ncbi:MAG: hypothetical protein K0S12_1772, partial [Bacteroidetes bacterium]|nr:hypothetical protein [Bacteroidota bacterium]
EVIGAACTLSGHWGYGYFDAKLETCPDHGTPNILTVNGSTLSLNPNLLGVQNPVCSSSVTMQAPSWPAVYDWNGPAGSGIYSHTIQSLNTNYMGWYTLSMGNSSVCPITKSIYYHSNTNPVLSMGPLSYTFCLNKTYTLIAYGAATYTWTNGQQGSTAVLTPTATGVFTIGVVGTNSAGCTANLTATCTVVTPPVISVSGPSLVCSGTAVTYTASGANSYQWTASMNSNTISGSGPMPVFTPTANTTVTVQGYDQSCSTKSVISTSVQFPVSIGLSANLNTICPGSTVTLSIPCSVASRTLTDGVTTWVTGPSLTVAPTVNTSYTASASNLCGTSSATLTVMTNSSVPVMTLGTLPSSCSNLTLTVSGAPTYTVNTGTSIVAGTSTNITIFSYPSGTSVFTVTGAFFNGGCTSTATISVTQPVTPTINITPFPPCQGLNTMTITGGSGPYTLTPMNSGYTQIAASFTTAGTFTDNILLSQYYYYVQTTAPHSCPYNAAYYYPVANMSALTISANTSTVCTGTSATLTASGGLNYTWNTGQTGNKIVVSPTTNTVYAVTYSAACGSVSQTIGITYLNTTVPAITLTPSSYSPCAFTTLTISATGASSYYWFNPPTGLSGNTFTYSNMLVPTTFTALGNHSNGCMSTATLGINTILTPITPTITGTFSLCPFTTTTYTALGITSHTWNTGANTYTTSFGPFTGPAPFPSIYSVTVKGIDANGCVAQSNVYGVQVGSAPFVFLNGSGTVCANTYTTLTINTLMSSALTSYTWSDGSTNSSTSVSPSVTTTYSLIGTGTNGCKGTGTIQVFTYPVSTVALNALPGPVCEGSAALPLVLTPSNAVGYASGSNVVINNIFYPSYPGTYTLGASLTNTNNCYSTNTLQTITVLSAPSVSLSAAQTTFCTNSSSLNLIGAPHRTCRCKFVSRYKSVAKSF